MRLRKGCGCMTVETASRVLASLSIIGSIIGIIIFAVVMSSADAQEALSHQYRTQREVIGPIGVCLIFSCLMNIGFAGLMIYGSVRRDPGYVFPYVALGFSGLVNLITFFISFVILAGMLLPIGPFFLLTMVFMSTAALQIYFWLILYSHYKDLSALKYGCQKNPNDGKVFSQPMNTYHNV